MTAEICFVVCLSCGESESAWTQFLEQMSWVQMVWVHL